MARYHYNIGLLLEEVLTAYSHEPALRFPDRVYSYERLGQLVDRLAELLLEKGLSRGDVIAIGHNKQPVSYALMLAALRLGIPYVNIDVASPVERNQRILATSRARILFFDEPMYSEAVRELGATSGSLVFFLSEHDLPEVSQDSRLRQKELARNVDGACIAYLMFTSGSTGNPKGVAVTHQNVLHFIEWGRERFEITPADNFANLSPMYFDNSVFDFYVGLFNGASLTPVPRELMTKPYELVQRVADMECTVWFSVPSLLMYVMTMKALSGVELKTLRHIVFGGEGYPKTELKKLYAMFSGQAQLVNVYGPTECTCICSAHTVREVDFLELEGFPTLGRLNQNFDYQILDEEGQEASSGELCLIGPNVASGYFNDPDLTNASFLTLTEPKRYLKRMYRTGDLVREEGGELYFVGRKDNQIKHMGYRIELEEIEHALMRLAHVDQAAAIYHRVKATHGTVIAFVATSFKYDEQPFLAQLKEFLPDYMIPGKCVFMPQLPKNPNGKVDKHKLRSMALD
jgi:D-alanine--poly(phosphoribitol) ligase subunit 1